MIKIVSFGVKHRKAPPGFAVFDCTTLKNPHSIPELRAKTGLDKEVRDYVIGNAVRFNDIVADALAVVERGVPRLAFACVGGKHRSVAVAEQTAGFLRQSGHEVELKHLELHSQIA